MKSLVYSILFGLSLSTAWASAGLTRIEKTASVNLEVEKDVNIEIDGSNTDMHIEIWDEPRIEIEAIFRYRGEKNSDKITEFLGQFQQHIEEGILQSPGAVRIETYRSLPEKVKLGVADFVILQYTYSKDEVQLEYRIKMPAKGKVNIKHSYRDLRIDGNLNQLELSQYSGRLALDKVKEAKLSLKYGEAYLKRLDKGDIYLYENDLQAEQIDELKLNIKYCQLRSRDIKTLDVEAYESEIELQRLKAFSGNFKYSSLIAERVKSFAVVSYESRFKIKEVKSMNLSDSKYSRYDIDQVEQVNVEQAFEDRMRIKVLKAMNAGDSKYCKHEIDALDESYSLNGYESTVRIDKLSGAKGNISINGKYMKVEINTAEAIFDLVANMRYGNIDYRKAAASGEISENGNETIAKVRSIARKEGEGFNILIDGYEMKVELY
ncbi:MAG: hypothetical protein NXI09_02495 [Bacteroidetes bacterium]|nr:hypothetical protein [Bacteroidota bacterium]